jgi:hypothetical protein
MKRFVFVFGLIVMVLSLGACHIEDNIIETTYIPKNRPNPPVVEPSNSAANPRPPSSAPSRYKYQHQKAYQTENEFLPSRPVIR